jgi:hypothetical protein
MNGPSALPQTLLLPSIVAGRDWAWERGWTGPEGWLLLTFSLPQTCINYFLGTNIFHAFFRQADRVPLLLELGGRSRGIH